MSAAELGHRVVAVAEEDRAVEARRALALLAVEGPRDGALQVAGELVEEEPPERARIARVAGEERSLDRFRQVHQREHRPVEVGEVGREQRPLLLAEAFNGVAHRRGHTRRPTGRR